MFGAGAGLAARADLAALGDIATQQIGLLVIHRVDLFSTELTDPHFADKTTGAIVAFKFFFISRSANIVSTHNEVLLLSRRCCRGLAPAAGWGGRPLEGKLVFRFRGVGWRLF